MGNYRYYLCPEYLIKESELPDGWGLIYVDNKGKTKEIKESKLFALNESGIYNERCFLYSIARRMMGNKEPEVR